MVTRPPVLRVGDLSSRWCSAVTLAYLGEDIEVMLTLIDRALALRPSFARGWNVSGALRCLAGQPELAIAHLDTARRLSPRTRVGRPMVHVGIAHFVSRRFEDAIPKLLLAIHEDPSYPNPHRFLAAAYAHLGRLDEAREVIRQLRTVTSLLIPNADYLRNPEHRELILSGLRLAAGDAD
jgi:tetratricopeptide (TPR) repeat protein